MIWLMALVLATQTAQTPVRVGSGIAQPQKIKDVKPVYPAEAQRSGAQGVVILEAVVGADGKVSDAKVLRSIPLLDQAALDAVKQWEYTPTVVNGTAVPVIMTVTVNFTMQGGGPSSPPPPGFSPLSNLQPAKPGMVRLTVGPAPGGAALMWDITAERAAALPRWNPQSAPSVSMEDAARIAEDSLRARLPDVRRFEVQSINFSRVRRSNPEIDFWYYDVRGFIDRTPPRPGDQLQRVVILPDGTVVEPQSDQNPR